MDPKLIVSKKSKLAVRIGILRGINVTQYHRQVRNSDGAPLIILMLIVTKKLKLVVRNGISHGTSVTQHHHQVSHFSETAYNLRADYIKEVKVRGEEWDITWDKRNAAPSPGTCLKAACF